MKNFKLGLPVFCVFLLIACAAPLKQTVIENENPEYEGLISPISIPITPEYKPAKYRIELSSVTVSDKVSMEISIIGFWTISPLEDSLSSDTSINITSVKRNGRSVFGTAPVMNIRVLMTRHGEVEEVECFSSAFEDQKQLDEFCNNMRNEAMRTAGLLNKKPVRTGDWIIRAPIGDEFFDILVKGYGFLGDKRVIVAEYDDCIYVEGVTICAKGYRLIDPETFFPIKEEIYFSCPNDPGDIRGYVVYLAEKM